MLEQNIFISSLVWEYRKSYCTASGVSVSEMLHFLHLSFSCDGQGTDRGAVLYRDSSCFSLFFLFFLFFFFFFFFLILQIFFLSLRAKKQTTKFTSAKILVPYFLGYKTDFFSFQNNPKDLDLSYKTDLDL